MSGLSDGEALRRVRRDPEAIVALYDRHVARLAAALAATRLSVDDLAALPVAQQIACTPASRWSLEDREWRCEGLLVTRPRKSVRRLGYSGGSGWEAPVG